MATAAGFFLFGLSAIVLSVTLFPLLQLLPRPRKHRWARTVLSFVFLNYLRLLRWMGVISYKLHNTRCLRSPGQLIIANHPSLLDAVFLIALTGNASCLVKRDLWNNPFTGVGVRTAGYISNGRVDLVSACVDTLRCGDSLIVFPEGTRSKPSEPLCFHRTPFRIALAATVPITPVVIRCEPPVLLKDRKWYEVPSQTPHYSIRVEETLPIIGYHEGESSNVAARSLAGELAQYFEVRR